MKRRPKSFQNCRTLCKKWGLSLFLGLSPFLVLTQAFAFNPVETFNNANSLYGNEKFEESILQYEDLLKNRYYSAEIYYNLGNAYFKINKIGKATLNYYRALRISPRNDDIKFNLEFVESRISEAPKTENAFTQFLKDIYYSFNLVELTIYITIIYWLIIILIIICLFRRISVIRTVSMILGVMFLLFLCWFGTRLYMDKKVVEAVVMESQTEARNGPGDEYAVGFTVPEGKKVLIIGANNDWVAIGLSVEGLKGWIKSSKIEKI